MRDRTDQWRFNAGPRDLLVARRVVATVALDRRLAPDDARRALGRAVRGGWSVDAHAQELAALARSVARELGLPRVGSARAVIEAALTRRVLVAWYDAPLAPVVRPTRPEGESADAEVYIPLASELIRELYEQGIEVDDELIEDDPGAIEFWDVASDEPADAVEVEDEAEDEPADAVELADEVDDTPPESAARAETAAGAAVPTSEDDAEIEVEDSVEDDESDAIEEESEGDDSAEPDWGDAVDPADEAPAAAEGGETGSR